MKNDLWIGKKGFKYWYFRFLDSEYSSLGIIGFTVIVSLVLIFNVIIPQVNSWFSIREETIATRERIAILEQNTTYINNLDQNLVNNQLQTATNALPIEKDFGAVLDSLSQAAQTSGVSLNDFSFQVGDVASTSATSNTSSQDMDSIRITLVIGGNADGIKRFVRNIEKTVPIAEVTDIDGSGQSAAVSIQFYQKSFPNIVVDENKQLSPISADKVALLQTLASWKKAIPLAVPAGSASAMPLF